MLSHREIGEHARGTPPVIRSSAGGSGLFVSRRRRPGLSAGAAAACPSRQAGSARVMHSTPQNASRDTSRARFSSGRFRPLFRAFCRPVWALRTWSKIRAAKPCTRGPKAWRSGHFGTLVGATGGTQTHSRRTGWKLGHVRYARQGLVRVPESNTKYGGWWGITGGGAAPVIEPTIGESSGIPKPKKFVRPVDRRFAPLFTGQLFIGGGGLNFRDSRKATGKLRSRHVRAVMAGRQNRGQGGR